MKTIYKGEVKSVWARNDATTSATMCEQNTEKLYSAYMQFDDDEPIEIDTYDGIGDFKFQLSPGNGSVVFRQTRDGKQFKLYMEEKKQKVGE